MSKARWLLSRACRCDTGEFLNPLMHVFLYITLIFSIAYVFFGDTDTVQTSILYQETSSFGNFAVNLWGITGMVVIVTHTIGIIIRGRYGLPIMQIAMFGGAFMWLWAAIVYYESGSIFQMLAAAVPNLAFWTWYAWQWRRRYNHLDDPTFKAFV